MTAISLITGTAGRIDELKRLGDSLTRQIMTDFEWIIIDQNQDGRLTNVLSDLSNRLKMRVLPMDPNLSRALNAGADAARSAVDRLHRRRLPARAGRLGERNNPRAPALRRRADVVAVSLPGQ